MVEILAGVRQAPVSNSELILAVFPKTRQENEAVFIISNYLLLVDSEVVTKKKELLTETVKGFIEAKMQVDESFSTDTYYTVIFSSYYLFS